MISLEPRGCRDRTSGGIPLLFWGGIAATMAVLLTESWRYSVPAVLARRLF